MWLMTKYGFYSIVQKTPGEYHVRSREMKDIENLVKHVPLPNADLKNTTGKDYAARIVVTADEVLAIVKFLSENIDYHNFKDKIDSIPDQRHKPYHRVWTVLAEALGAYGRKGRDL
jgi:hypothetical protein